MNVTGWALACIPTMLAVTTVVAAQAPVVSFEDLDGDRDGFVARDEIPADHELARTFTTHDADGDGRLSAGEFDSYQSDAETTEEY